MKNYVLAAAALLAALPAVAHADVDEVRLAYVDNIRDDHGDIIDGKEGSNAEVELVFSSPALLNLLGSPRPYIMASGNVDGDGVNFGGVGLYWRWEFADGWALEPGFGYVVHDGEIDNAYASGTPEAAAFEAEHQLLGSRDLFRNSLALEREFGDRFALHLYWEHMSHGQILDEGRNQGLDYVGLRGVFRFNPDPARD